MTCAATSETMDKQNDSVIEIQMRFTKYIQDTANTIRFLSFSLVTLFLVPVDHPRKYSGYSRRKRGAGKTNQSVLEGVRLAAVEHREGGGRKRSELLRKQR